MRFVCSGIKTLHALDTHRLNMICFADRHGSGPLVADVQWKSAHSAECAVGWIPSVQRALDKESEKRGEGGGTVSEMVERYGCVCGRHSNVNDATVVGAAPCPLRAIIPEGMSKPIF